MEELRILPVLTVRVCEEAETVLRIGIILKIIILNSLLVYYP